MGATFPKVFYLGTDPTGLDTIERDASCANLVQNVVDGVIFNGHPLAEIFSNDENNPLSLYGAIAKATQLAEQGHIRTIFLDNLTYLIDPMYWQYREGDEAKDKRQVFGQVATFASDLVLSRLLPLATRNGVNIVISMHVQRESKEAVEGVDAYAGRRATNSPELVGGSKRHINLKSDLSPMVMGSLRQKIGGMPSAMLWLNNEATANGLKFYAYTQKQYVKSWDAEIDAKNRYGLPPALDLTATKENPHPSLYATLVQASKKALAARPDLKAAAATTTAPAGDQPLPQPALDAQKETIK